jgi:methane/ammonia monooxygenase subunit B
MVELGSMNDEAELTGKVHVFSGWPQAAARPEDHFSTSAAGPVLSQEHFVGSAVTHFSMDVSGTEYKIVLKARRRLHHVHVRSTSRTVDVGPGQDHHQGDMKDSPIPALSKADDRSRNYGIT